MLSAFKSDSDKARAEIARLNAARERLAIARGNAEKELAKLYRELPDIELAEMIDEGPPSEPSRARITELQSSVERIDAAFAALIQRQAGACDMLREARSQALLRQAEGIGKQRAALVKKFEAAMRVVEEISGAQYVSKASYVRQVAMLVGPAGVGANFGVVTVPKHEQMAIDENQLRDQAFAMTQGSTRSSGKLRAESLDALIAALSEQVQNDELRIIPSAAEVRNFFAPKIADAETAWDRSITIGGERVTVPCTVKLELAWKDGRIDTAGSRVFCEAAPRVNAIPLSAGTRV